MAGAPYKIKKKERKEKKNKTTESPTVSSRGQTELKHLLSDCFGICWLPE